LYWDIVEDEEDEERTVLIYFATQHSSGVLIGVGMTL